MAQNPSKRSREEADNVDFRGQTDIQLDAFSFTWSMSNYSFMSDVGTLESPVFYGGPKSKHGWKVMVRKKNKLDDTDYVSLYLKLFKNGLNGKDTPVKAHFNISIINADGLLDVHAFRDRDKMVHDFTKDASSWGVPKVITSANLVDPNRRLVVNDTLKLFCQVWINGEIKEKVTTCKGQLSDEQRIVVCKKKLANDLGKMFSQSIGTDCRVLIGKSSFKAHKAILSARSSVFAAMFDANMAERKSGILEIVDFDKEVVKGMLEYLYTGETTVMAARAQELLQIAEKYNLEGLKEDCEYAIIDKLGMDNVAEIFALAQTHNAPTLKEHAITFIIRNKERLMKLKSFQDAVKVFASTGLLVDLYLSDTN